MRWFLTHPLLYIQSRINNVINVLGQTKKGFTDVLLEPVVDHVPTRYAIHIWNNISEVD